MQSEAGILHLMHCILISLHQTAEKESGTFNEFMKYNLRVEKVKCFQTSTDGSSLIKVNKRKFLVVKNVQKKDQDISHLTFLLTLISHAHKLVVVS